MKLSFDEDMIEFMLDAIDWFNCTWKGNNLISRTYIINHNNSLSKDTYVTYKIRVHSDTVKKYNNETN